MKRLCLSFYDMIALSSCALAALVSLPAGTIPIAPRIRRLLAAEQAVPASLAFRADGDAEVHVPDVSLTRSRDKSTGTATFRFERASVLQLNDVWNNGLITGLWLQDEEGMLSTQDVKVTFRGGRPAGVVALLVLKNSDEWKRFMRFMRRYAEANDLSFESASET